MKFLCGITLLCLSAGWILFWCSQSFEPVRSDFAGFHQALIVLVASLALIPVFCAVWLLDGAWRAPVAPDIAPIAWPVRKRHFEAKTESAGQFAGLTPDARGTGLPDRGAETSATAEPPKPAAA